MDSHDNNKSFLLGDFLVEPEQSTVASSSGDTAEVRLEPKIMAVLVYLAQHPGQVISRDQLMDAVWANVVVSDETITRSISELRQVLGDSSKEPSYIQTIPKKGYRLLIEPSTTEPSTVASLKTTNTQQVTTSNRNWLPILTTIGLTGLVIALFLFNFSKQGTPEPTPSVLPSIAVLPFINMSGNEDNEYFSDGLTEELLSTLARGGELRVTGRTSSFQFKGKHEDLRAIGRQLNVSHLLEGSVRRTNDQVRITAQLVSATDGMNIWSKSFDRTLDDIFVVQAEIAQAIATALKVELSLSNTTVKAPSPKAYDLYLRGLRAQRLPGPDNLETALAYLKEAVALDPTLAVAWQKLANTYASMTAATLLPRDEGVQLANHAINQALELDPGMAAAYSTLGSLYSNFEREWDKAEAAYQHSLEIDPHNSDALSGASLLAAARGQQAKALAYNQRSIVNDPFHLGALHNKGFIQYLGRDFAAAEQSIRDAREFAGGSYVYSGTVLSLILLAQGRAEEALAAAKEELGTPWSLSAQTLAYHALGHKEESDLALTQLIENHGDRIAIPIAGCFAYRGELEEAFEWLDRGYAQGDPQLLVSAVHPANDNLRSHPRWQAFLDKLNLDLSGSQ